jgi:hypothetical protein
MDPSRQHTKSETEPQCVAKSAGGSRPFVRLRLQESQSSHASNSARSSPHGEAERWQGMPHRVRVSHFRSCVPGSVWIPRSFAAPSSSSRSEPGMRSQFAVPDQLSPALDSDTVLRCAYCSAPIPTTSFVFLSASRQMLSAVCPDCDRRVTLMTAAWLASGGVPSNTDELWTPTCLLDAAVLMSRRERHTALQASRRIRQTNVGRSQTEQVMVMLDCDNDRARAAL